MVRVKKTPQKRQRKEDARSTPLASVIVVSDDELDFPSLPRRIRDDVLAPSISDATERRWIHYSASCAPPSKLVLARQCLRTDSFVGYYDEVVEYIQNVHSCQVLSRSELDSIVYGKMKYEQRGPLYYLSQDGTPDSVFPAFLIFSHPRTPFMSSFSYAEVLLYLCVPKSTVSLFTHGDNALFSNYSVFITFAELFFCMPLRSISSLARLCEGNGISLVIPELSRREPRESPPQLPMSENETLPPFITVAMHPHPILFSDSLSEEASLPLPNLYSRGSPSLISHPNGQTAGSGTTLPSLQPAKLTHGVIQSCLRELLNCPSMLRVLGSDPTQLPGFLKEETLGAPRADQHNKSVPTVQPSVVISDVLTSLPPTLYLPLPGTSPTADSSFHSKSNSPLPFQSTSVATDTTSHLNPRNLPSQSKRQREEENIYCNAAPYPELIPPGALPPLPVQYKLKRYQERALCEMIGRETSSTLHRSTLIALQHWQNQYLPSHDSDTLMEGASMKENEVTSTDAAIHTGDKRPGISFVNDSIAVAHASRGSSMDESSLSYVGAARQLKRLQPRSAELPHPCIWVPMFLYYQDPFIHRNFEGSSIYSTLRHLYSHCLSFSMSKAAPHPVDVTQDLSSPLPFISTGFHITLPPQWMLLYTPNGSVIYASPDRGLIRLIPPLMDDLLFLPSYIHANMFNPRFLYAFLSNDNNFLANNVERFKLFHSRFLDKLYSLELPYPISDFFPSQPMPSPACTESNYLPLPGVFADSMGLGKTAVVLALLLYSSIKNPRPYPLPPPSINSSGNAPFLGTIRITRNTQMRTIPIWLHILNSHCLSILKPSVIRSSDILSITSDNHLLGDLPAPSPAASPLATSALHMPACVCGNAPDFASPQAGESQKYSSDGLEWLKCSGCDTWNHSICMGYTQKLPPLLQTMVSALHFFVSTYLPASSDGVSDSSSLDTLVPPYPMKLHEKYFSLHIPHSSHRPHSTSPPNSYTIRPIICHGCSQIAQHGSLLQGPKANSLIVTPKTLQHQWVNEMKKHLGYVPNTPYDSFDDPAYYWDRNSNELLTAPPSDTKAYIPNKSEQEHRLTMVVYKGVKNTLQELKHKLSNLTAVIRRLCKLALSLYQMLSAHSHVVGNSSRPTSARRASSRSNTPDFGYVSSSTKSSQHFPRPKTALLQGLTKYWAYVHRVHQLQLQITRLACALFPETATKTDVFLTTYTDLAADIHFLSNRDTNKFDVLNYLQRSWETVQEGIASDFTSLASTPESTQPHLFKDPESKLSTNLPSPYSINLLSTAPNAPWTHPVLRYLYRNNIEFVAPDAIYRFSRIRLFLEEQETSRQSNGTNAEPMRRSSRKAPTLYTWPFPAASTTLPSGSPSLSSESTATAGEKDDTSDARWKVTNWQQPPEPLEWMLFRNAFGPLGLDASQESEKDTYGFKSRPPDLSTRPISINLPAPPPQSARRLRQRFVTLSSPLLFCHFYRILVDEAQIVDSSLSQASQAVRNVSGDHIWAVSGTPLPGGARDLSGLLMYLGVTHWKERPTIEAELVTPLHELEELDTTKTSESEAPAKKPKAKKASAVVHNSMAESEALVPLPDAPVDVGISKHDKAWQTWCQAVARYMNPPPHLKLPASSPTISSSSILSLPPSAGIVDIEVSESPITVTPIVGGPSLESPVEPPKKRGRKSGEAKVKRKPRVVPLCLFDTDLGCPKTMSPVLRSVVSGHSTGTVIPVSYEGVLVPPSTRYLYSSYRRNQALVYRIAQSLFWRNTAESTQDERQLPPMYEEEIWLRFSPTERVFYSLAFSAFRPVFERMIHRWQTAAMQSRNQARNRNFSTSIGDDGDVAEGEEARQNQEAGEAGDASTQRMEVEGGNVRGASEDQQSETAVVDVIEPVDMSQELTYVEQSRIMQPLLALRQICVHPMAAGSALDRTRSRGRRRGDRGVTPWHFAQIAEGDEQNAERDLQEGDLSEEGAMLPMGGPSLHSMSYVMDTLLKKSLSEEEEALRVWVTHTLGIAGLFALKGERVTALREYLDVLYVAALSEPLMTPASPNPNGSQVPNEAGTANEGMETLSPESDNADDVVETSLPRSEGPPKPRVDRYPRYHACVHALALVDELIREHGKDASSLGNFDRTSTNSVESPTDKEVEVISAQSGDHNTPAKRPSPEFHIPNWVVTYATTGKLHSSSANANNPTAIPHAPASVTLLEGLKLLRRVLDQEREALVLRLLVQPRNALLSRLYQYSQLFTSFLSRVWSDGGPGVLNLQDHTHSSTSGGMSHSRVAFEENVISRFVFGPNTSYVFPIEDSAVSKASLIGPSIPVPTHSGTIAPSTRSAHTGLTPFGEKLTRTPPDLFQLAVGTLLRQLRDAPATWSHLLHAAKAVPARAAPPNSAEGQASGAAAWRWPVGSFGVLEQLLMRAVSELLDIRETVLKAVSRCFQRDAKLQERFSNCRICCSDWQKTGPPCDLCTTRNQVLKYLECFMKKPYIPVSRRKFLRAISEDAPEGGASGHKRQRNLMEGDLDTWFAAHGIAAPDTLTAGMAAETARNMALHGEDELDDEEEEAFVQLAEYISSDLSAFQIPSALYRVCTALFQTVDGMSGTSGEGSKVVKGVLPAQVLEVGSCIHELLHPYVTYQDAPNVSDSPHPVTVNIIVSDQAPPAAASGGRRPRSLLKPQFVRGANLLRSSLSFFVQETHTLLNLLSMQTSFLHASDEIQLCLTRYSVIPTGSKRLPEEIHILYPGEVAGKRMEHELQRAEAKRVLQRASGQVAYVYQVYTEEKLRREGKPALVPTKESAATANAKAIVPSSSDISSHTTMGKKDGMEAQLTKKGVPGTDDTPLTTGPECHICQGPLGNDSNGHIAFLSSCYHRYCTSCITLWLKNVLGALYPLWAYLAAVKQNPLLLSQSATVLDSHQAPQPPAHSLAREGFLKKVQCPACRVSIGSGITGTIIHQYRLWYPHRKQTLPTPLTKSSIQTALQLFDSGIVFSTLHDDAIDRGKSQLGSSAKEDLPDAPPYTFSTLPEAILSAPGSTTGTLGLHQPQPNDFLDTLPSTAEPSSTTLAPHADIATHSSTCYTKQEAHNTLPSPTPDLIDVPAPSAAIVPGMLRHVLMPDDFPVPEEEENISREYTLRGSFGTKIEAVTIGILHLLRVHNDHMEQFSSELREYEAKYGNRWRQSMGNVSLDDVNGMNPEMDEDEDMDENEDFGQNDEVGDLDISVNLDLGGEMELIPPPPEPPIPPQCIIFSQWTTTLQILHTCLQRNSISSILALSPKQLAKLLPSFLPSDSKATIPTSSTPSTPLSPQPHPDSPTAPVTVLLLPYRLGSEGLTLVNANHVFLLDPHPDISIERQAIARVHRIGQTRSTFVHRLFVRDSIEETLFRDRSRQSIGGKRLASSATQRLDEVMKQRVDSDNSADATNLETQGKMPFDWTEGSFLPKMRNNEETQWIAKHPNEFRQLAQFFGGQLRKIQRYLVTHLYAHLVHVLFRKIAHYFNTTPINMLYKEMEHSLQWWRQVINSSNSDSVPIYECRTSSDLPQDPLVDFFLYGTIAFEFPEPAPENIHCTIPPTLLNGDSRCKPWSYQHMYAAAKLDDHSDSASDTVPGLKGLSGKVTVEESRKGRKATIQTKGVADKEADPDDINRNLMEENDTIMKGIDFGTLDVISGDKEDPRRLGDDSGDLHDNSDISDRAKKSSLTYSLRYLLDLQCLDTIQLGMLNQEQQVTRSDIVELVRVDSQFAELLSSSSTAFA